jgi:protein CpxP
MKISGMIVSAILVCAATANVEAQAVGGAQPQTRSALEQQLRQRMAQVVRNRLQLDTAQMAQLQNVNERYAPQLGGLATQERETRQRLRKQMTAATPNQDEVGKLLDNLLRLQRQRVGLLESEQKDLSVFLTPVQRAKYMGLQAQIKRRAEQLRRQNVLGAAGRARTQPLR